MQGQVAECSTYYNCMQLQALDLSFSSFHEFLPILLTPVPSSHWALWSQSLTAFRPVPISATGPWHRARRIQQQAAASTHVHPAPSPLCCASTLCSHMLSQVVGPIQLEACLSVERHRAVSQSGQALSPAHCAGVSRVPAPAHWCQPPAPQTNGWSAQQTWTAGLCLQLAQL